MTKRYGISQAHPARAEVPEAGEPAPGVPRKKVG